MNTKAIAQYSSVSSCLRAWRSYLKAKSIGLSGEKSLSKSKRNIAMKSSVALLAILMVVTAFSPIVSSEPEALSDDAKRILEDVQSKKSMNENDRVRGLSVLLITFDSAGHSYPMLALGEALIEKGHRVTLLANEVLHGHLNSTSTNLRRWCEKRQIKFSSAGAHPLLLPRRPENAFATISGVIREGWSICGLQERMLNTVKSDASLIQSADVIVVDYFYVSVMEWLNENTDSTVITLTPIVPQNKESMPSWYFPTVTNGPPNPTFLHRFEVVTTKIFLKMITLFRPMKCYPLQSPAGTYNPNIISTSIGFEYPRPFYPLDNFVGPLVSTKNNQLPPNLREWLGSHSPQSVVYLSMGSYMPLDGNLARGIVHGVMETGYDLLWSLKNSYHEILQEVEQSYLNSSRVVISDWLPQAAVLNHTSIAMAVLHGGSGGVNEALLAGVPIICLPQAADQPTNCARVKYQGLGENFGVVDDLTVSEVKQAIHYIKEHNCREKAKKVSKIFRKAGGASKAVELIEYYHEMGYDHLVPSWAKYNWTFIQYYNLDVNILLGVVVSLLILLLWKLGKLCKRSMHKTVKID